MSREAHEFAKAIDGDPSADPPKDAMRILEAIREAIKGADGHEDDEDEPEEGEAESHETELAAADALECEADLDDLSKPMKDEAEAAARTDARVHRRYVPDPEVRKLDRYMKPSRTHGIENYNKAKDDVAQQIGAIRGRQLAYIQTITRKRIVGGLDAGRLDDAALSHVRTGSRAVFTDVTRGRNLDTAIEVLVDLSGSMGDGDHRSFCAYYAKRTAIALAESWEPLRIPYEVIGFTNNHARGFRSSDPNVVHRVPFDFYVFKAWNERLVQCRERFTAIQGYGDNADGEAVHAAACRLAGRREKRKLLVVISDGVPCHGGVDREMLDAHLRDTVRLVSKSGIEVLGVGAGTDAPAKFYNAATGATNLIIKDFSQLPTKLFAAMQQRIIGAA